MLSEVRYRKRFGRSGHCVEHSTSGSTRKALALDVRPTVQCTLQVYFLQGYLSSIATMN